MAPRRPRDARTGDLFATKAQAHHPQPPPEAGMRAMIEELIAQTELYSTSAEFRQLLTFVARMRRFCPLLTPCCSPSRSPGLTHAATARDWFTRFGRKPKRHARPLLVLSAMGPVDFAFDVLDTEGPDLPLRVSHLERHDRSAVHGARRTRREGGNRTGRRRPRRRRGWLDRNDCVIA